MKVAAGFDPGSGVKAGMMAGLISMTFARRFLGLHCTACGELRAVTRKPMKRVNLDPNEDFIGNRPPNLFDRAPSRLPRRRPSYNALHQKRMSFQPSPSP
jgi:hypothetical protein